MPHSTTDVRLVRTSTIERFAVGTPIAIALDNPGRQPADHGHPLEAITTAASLFERRYPNRAVKQLSEDRSVPR